MSTYVYQYQPGSATAASDYGMFGLGRVATGDISTIIPLTAANTAYQITTYDASGRVFIVGSVRASASYAAGQTQGVLSYVVATTNAPSLGDARFYPFFSDLAGNLRITATATWPVFATAAWGVSGTVGLNATTVTASQNGVIWGVTASAVTASQNGVVWGVTASAVTASQNGVVWGVTASAVTANLASATGVTADAIGGENHPAFGAFTYIKSSGANLWDRWAAVPSGATASGVTGLPMVAPMWQFDDSGTIAAVENFFGVPRMNSNRIAYITATAALPVGVTGSAFVQGNVGITGSAFVQGNVGITGSAFVQQGGIWGVTASAVTASIASGTVTLASGSIAAITSNAGTLGGITVSSTATVLKAANTARKSILIVNNGSVNLYIGTSTAVTTAGGTMGIRLAPSGSYSDAGWGLYTGDLYGVCSAVVSAIACVWERT